MEQHQNIHKRNRMTLMEDIHYSECKCLKKRRSGKSLWSLHSCHPAFHTRG